MQKFVCRLVNESHFPILVVISLHCAIDERARRRDEIKKTAHDSFFTVRYTRHVLVSDIISMYEMNA